MTFTQSEFDVRCEWGEHGLAALAPASDAIVIVDVMSFTTCVSIAVARGAIIFPYRSRDDALVGFAASVKAIAAGPRGKGGYSLSPASFLHVPSGTHVVLPSLNGATLTLAAGHTPTFAGSLRNAKTVAEAAMRCGRRISVIPAGERWKRDHSLRPSFEDLVGAGAIIHHLRGTLSPEARLAADAFRAVAASLPECLKACSSGKELAEMGFEEDIALIAALDVDTSAPMLIDGAYRTAD